MKFTSISLSLFLVPVTALCMEMEPAGKPASRQSHEVVVLDLEEGRSHHINPKLSADLVRSIKAGRVSHINQLLTKRTKRSGDTQVGMAQSVDDIVGALGFTQGELELQQQQMAQKVFDNFMARYKQAAVPMLLTALSLVNIGTNAYYYANPPAGTSPQTTSSFGVNMAASGAAALGFGYESYLQIKKGWTDHRQKKLVEQLKNSQLLLQLLHDNAMKDGVITPQEQATIDAEQAHQAQLQVQVAQATLDAQNVDAEIAASHSNNGQGQPVAVTPNPAFNLDVADDEGAK